MVRREVPAVLRAEVPVVVVVADVEEEIDGY
jgi:hypothetical protein